ncbi:MAG: hypothetical protein M3245_01390 [Actinomycetota bacterium]|nr:hypothetical protein [Actinomycetota bacterium]
MELDQALARYGFAETQSRRGTRSFSSSPTPFLTYWVHLYDDGTALFSWEFAIAAYVATRGLQIGSDEHLNTFLYPRQDVRGPQDGAWLTAQMDAAETVLRSLTFVHDEADADPTA